MILYLVDAYQCYTTTKNGKESSRQNKHSKKQQIKCMYIIKHTSIHHYIHYKQQQSVQSWLSGETATEEQWGRTNQVTGVSLNS